MRLETRICTTRATDRRPNSALLRRTRIAGDDKKPLARSTITTANRRLNLIEQNAQFTRTLSASGFRRREIKSARNRNKRRRVCNRKEVARRSSTRRLSSSHGAPLAACRSRCDVEMLLAELTILLAAVVVCGEKRRGEDFWRLLSPGA